MSPGTLHIITAMGPKVINNDKSHSSLNSSIHIKLLNQKIFFGIYRSHQLSNTSILQYSTAIIYLQ